MLSRSAGSQESFGREGARRAAPRSITGWWLRPGASMVWRVPLFLLVVLAVVLFGFHGLVHLAFLFVAHPVATFLFAPALLPFAALPAICFLYCLRLVVWAWRNDELTPGQKQLATGGAPLAAYLLAQIINIVQVNLIRMMGIGLPRLPLDPF